MRVFTQRDVEKMLEEEFVREVIMPILEGQGWQEVQNWHGRQELGKDVVGWRVNPELGHLETVAVVAKASPPSGAQGVAVISTQITQALRRPFRTRSTQRELAVDQVWVMVNKPLSKETRDSIGSGIVLPHGRLHIFDLEDCWRLAQPFVLTSKREALQLSQDILRDTGSPYDLRLVTTERGQTLEVHERYPGQSAELPLKGRVVFSFEDHSKRQELAEYLRRLEETGEEEKLPEGISARVETDAIDHIAQQLFGELPTEMSLLMGSAETNEKIRLAFLVAPLNEPPVEVPFLEMDIVARGTKQMRLVNEQQNLPIRVEWLVKYEGEMIFNFNVKIGEASAHWVYKGLKLLEAIKRRGTITITNVDTGIVMRQYCVAIPQDNHDSLSVMTDVSKVLAAVEERTERVVVIPERAFTREEVHILEELRLIVNQGFTEGTATEFQMDFLVNRGILDDFLMEVSGIAQAGVFRARSEEVREIFGTSVHLGRSVVTFPSAVLSNEDDIRAAVQHAELDEDKAVAFHFRTIGEGKVRKDFIDWQDGRILEQRETTDGVSSS